MVLYVRHLLREMIRRGWNVHLVTTSAAAEHPSFRLVLDDGGVNLTTSFMLQVPYPKKLNAVTLFRYQVRQWREFRRAFAAASSARSEAFDAVYVPKLDYLDKALALLGSPFGRTSFSGLLMTPRYHHAECGVIAPQTRSDTLYRALFERVLRIPSLTSVAVIDEPYSEYMARSPAVGADKVYFVPDMAAIRGKISRAMARAALGVAEDRIVIISYGYICQRKGIAELISAVANPGCLKKVTLLLAGKQDEYARVIVASEAGRQLLRERRLIVRDGFQDDDDEYLVHRAADVAWIGYRDFYGMSGTLIQAGRMGLPVIASRDGLVGWLTERYTLGERIDIRDVTAAVSALNRLADDPARRAAFGAAGSVMASRHSPVVFAGRVCDRIEATISRAA